LEPARGLLVADLINGTCSFVDAERAGNDPEMNLRGAAIGTEKRGI